jgi:hypothetical protein
MDKVNYYAVQWLESKTQEFEPTYLYTMEKGYFLLPDEAKSRHNIRTANVSISARHPCFGNRWQQLLINRVVGYDTIIMNSLQNSAGQGYLYNYQTREFYNLSYSQELPDGSAHFGGLSFSVTETAYVENFPLNLASLSIMSVTLDWKILPWLLY